MLKYYFKHKTLSYNSNAVNHIIACNAAVLVEIACKYCGKDLYNSSF